LEHKRSSHLSFGKKASEKKLSEAPNEETNDQKEKTNEERKESSKEKE